MPDRPRPSLWTPSRRQFLAGAAATSLLAACGSGSDDGETGTGNGGDGGGSVELDPDDLSIVMFYGPYFAADTPARIPFGLSDSEGLLPGDVVPGNVTVSVRNPEGEDVADGLTAILRTDGLPRPYYSFEFTPSMPGFYDYRMEVEGSEVISQFQVVPPDDPTVADRIGPDQPMPALETPTTADARGVTPVCTREPACDLHDHTVADLLGAGPVALLVATPAYCQTVICGPILDILLDIVPDYPDISFVHAEVFRNPAENEVPPTPEDYAPVIEALGLPYEPVLYVTGPDGTVRERLDYIFDGSEMRRSLDRALV